MHRGLPRSKEKVSIHDASQGCPPSSIVMCSFSYGKPHARTGLHAMICTFYEFKWFDSRIKLNLFNSILLFSLVFFTIEIEFRNPTELIS
jgi:hypothetical protein